MYYIEIASSVRIFNVSRPSAVSCRVTPLHVSDQRGDALGSVHLAAMHQASIHCQSLYFSVLQGVFFLSRELFSVSDCE